ncbi:MAG: DUF3307 domain-containing protein [Candidatus Aureabacteria bacterium]|nr:DUF3307 domain-containing protein [Candidatus Auribacterota bacterium]
MLCIKVLLFAHLLADFPLQFGHIYRLKKRYLAGQLPHAIIYFMVMVAAGFPLLAQGRYWICAGALALSHLAIDLFKVRVLDPRSRGRELWNFLADQALHLVAIAIACRALRPLSLLVRDSLWGAVAGNGALSTAVFFCIATFAGTYLLDAARATFGRGGGSAADPVTRQHGLLERALFFIFMVAGGWWMALVPLVIAARVPLANHLTKQFRERGSLLSRGDLIGNLGLAAACAIAARLV